jgi:hypothetical protein
VIGIDVGSETHYASSGFVAAADCPVKRHDGCNRAVDLLRRFFLVCLDFSGRIGADEDVIHIPAETVFLHLLMQIVYF